MADTAGASAASTMEAMREHLHLHQLVPVSSIFIGITHPLVSTSCDVIAKTSTITMSCTIIKAGYDIRLCEADKPPEVRHDMPVEAALPISLITTASDGR